MMDRKLRDLFEAARASPAEVPNVQLRHARRDLFGWPALAAKSAFALGMILWAILVLPERLGYIPVEDMLGAALWESANYAGGVWAVALAISGPRYLYRLDQARRFCGPG